MNIKEYIKLLGYFDSILWGDKTTETNWNYQGLILDEYLDMSILSIDYLDIEDYFSSNGEFDFIETELLINQFKDVNEDKRLKLIESILNIFKQSTYDKDVSKTVITKTIKFLERNNIVVENPPSGDFRLLHDNIVGAGSYCVIKKLHKGVLKKELKPQYYDDSKLQKRMKYEYENMHKLRDCTQILNVHSYDEEEHSYLMEEADMNLFEYLNAEVDILFEKKIKIIYDILNGMKYAHNLSIIHRDLHLGNILKIGNDFLICDFGLSKDESIERSLKSSATEKNNHIFVDPLAIGDFTKLDKKSDIYSLGKLIDYIFTVQTSDSEHLFTFVVEKCSSRNKDKRYNTVEEILKDIEFKLKEQDSIVDKNKILEKIKNGILDVQVNELISNLVDNDRMCDYLVKHNLYSFGNIIIQLEQVDQISILNTINMNFEKSTGYGQFQNYDVFADIARFVCLNTLENRIYEIAYNILEGCATYRFSAKNYLDSLEASKI